MPVSKTTGVRTTSAATNIAKTLQDVYLAKRFVPFLHKNLVVAQFGDEENIPMHSGNKVRWLFNTTLDITAANTGNLTALTEGDDPSASNATTIAFPEATLATYGSYIEFTEELEDYAHPETMTQFSKLLGEAAARVVDTKLQSTATTGLLNTTTSQDAGTAMNANALRLCANQLRKNDALPHPKTPGGKHYATILSPEQSDDMAGEGNPAWFQLKTPTNNAVTLDPMHKPGMDSGPGDIRPEIEGLYNCAIYTSTNIQPDSNSPVNDQGLMIAANAFGISSFDSNIMKPTVKIVDPVPSLASPLGRRGLYLWKIKFAFNIFDVKRVAILLSDQS